MPRKAATDVAGDNSVDVKIPEDKFDEFVPDTQVIKEFHITPMTLWRWDSDEELDFPAPIKIRERKFRSRQALEAFKERMVRLAIAGRKREVAA